MKWSLIMGNIFRMIFGLPKAKGESKTQSYNIRPKMKNLDLVVMDYNSFRKSRKVRAQVSAAKDSVRA
ncbi:hypothetical protein [Enterovibrio nigricans]|uniref:Uncharacterized protein n=1 Tax=Enterovibrio nigricans DSM 22720 TaxID=1121868 RepID=A0A1T4WAA7_9GAMM|nr:hypothetical protein [Enterovibrio nigricans]PKF48773.1 hypothetical protein AT251_23745 [Enterovibrio nigricans]SKA74212.1 hypothetical protein SAMN02745132_04846 [Enterovibrio nigricans DSM 22720]